MTNARSQLFREATRIESDSQSLLSGAPGSFLSPFLDKHVDRSRCVYLSEDHDQSQEDDQEHEHHHPSQFG